MAPSEGVRSAVRGLSEAAFRERFGTDEACREALFGMRRRDGLTCPACAHGGFCRPGAPPGLGGGPRAFCGPNTRQPFQCNRCNRQVQLTAGTVFQDTKLPLT